MLRSSMPCSAVIKYVVTMLKESSNRNAAKRVRCSRQASHLLQLCQLPVVCQALRCDSQRLIPVWGLGLHQGYLLRHQEPAMCINVP